MTLATISCFYTTWHYTKTEELCCLPISSVCVWLWKELVLVCLKWLQGDHSPGKHGKIRELDRGQGKVRENGKSQESYNHHLASAREKDVASFLRYQSILYFSVFSNQCSKVNHYCWSNGIGWLASCNLCERTDYRWKTVSTKCCQPTGKVRERNLIWYGECSPCDYKLVVWLNYSSCSKWCPFALEMLWLCAIQIYYLLTYLLTLPLHMNAAVLATGFVDNALRNTTPSVNGPLLQLVNAVFRILCNVR